MDEIAGLLGTDRYFLRHYFRSRLQTDFRTWRSALRIREAQEIIRRNPRLPTNLVCEMAGFNHRANFHQQFLKITGLTPSEFRRQVLHGKG